MGATLLSAGQIVGSVLVARLAAITHRLDNLTLVAEGGQAQSRGGLPTWAIILIVVLAVLCLLPICVIAILTLLGPAIGNVFSNIIQEL